MRTTDKITNRQRARLFELAARRGEKGFSSLRRCPGRGGRRCVSRSSALARFMYMRVAPPLRVLACCLVALAACTQQIATEEDELSLTRLKYRLDDRYEVFYCDPDYYPVARDDEAELALERYPAIAADPEKLSAILEHLGLPADRELSDQEKLLVYREDKRLGAHKLESI